MSAKNIAGQPTRISLILHKFSRGGSDRVAAYLARGFADAGMDVDMIVFSKGGEVENILLKLVGDDIPVTYLGRASRWRALDLLRGLLPLARRLRSRKPDVVISTANNTSLATAIPLRLAGLRRSILVLKTTNPIATSRHKGIIRLLRSWTYAAIFQWTDAVWTLSADESAEMRAKFPRFAALFHDVANPYVTAEMLAPCGPAEARIGKAIVTIARLTSQKRVDRLIAAFAHLKTPGAQLVILGEGEDRAILAQQIARLGLDARVSMPGYVTDVASVLHRSDLFVLTSEYEGFPAAILEAMAANCSVLSTDCFPGARTLLEGVDGAGIIDNVDPSALAALIDRYLEQPRPAGLRSIAERYSVTNGVLSHRAALMDLLQSERRRD